MDRHLKVCSSETKMKFKECEYGSSLSARKQLEEIGILPVDYEIKFCSFDIETLPQKIKYDGKEFIEQKPVSIAYFDGENGHVFVGDNIVSQFLSRMEQIQVFNTFNRKKKCPSIFHAYAKLKTGPKKANSRKFCKSFDISHTIHEMRHTIYTVTHRIWYVSLNI